jgi:hypothetical protein
MGAPADFVIDAIKNGRIDYWYGAELPSTPSNEKAYDWAHTFKTPSGYMTFIPESFVTSGMKVPSQGKTWVSTYFQDPANVNSFVKDATYVDLSGLGTNEWNTKGYVVPGKGPNIPSTSLYSFETNKIGNITGLAKLPNGNLAYATSSGGYVSVPAKGVTQPTSWMDFGMGNMPIAYQVFDGSTPYFTPKAETSNNLMFNMGPVIKLAAAITGQPALYAFAAGMDAVEGNYLGAAMSAAGAVGNLPGVDAETARTAKTVYSGLQVANAIQNGNTIGALTALSGMTSGPSLPPEALKASQLIAVTSAIQKGDLAALAVAAGNMADNKDLSYAGKALNVVNAIQTGDVSKIAASLRVFVPELQAGYKAGDVKAIFDKMGYPLDATTTNLLETGLSTSPDAFAQKVTDPGLPMDDGTTGSIEDIINIINGGSGSLGSESDLPPEYQGGSLGDESDLPPPPNESGPTQQELQDYLDKLGQTVTPSPEQPAPTSPPPPQGYYIDEGNGKYWVDSKGDWNYVGPSDVDMNGNPITPPTETPAPPTQPPVEPPVATPEQPPAPPPESFYPPAPAESGKGYYDLNQMRYVEPPAGYRYEYQGESNSWALVPDTPVQPPDVTPEPTPVTPEPPLPIDTGVPTDDGTTGDIQDIIDSITSGSTEQPTPVVPEQPSGGSLGDESDLPPENTGGSLGDESDMPPENTGGSLGDESDLPPLTEEEPQCAAGYHWNGSLCVADTDVEDTSTTCPDGYLFDLDTQSCVPIGTTTPVTPKPPTTPVTPKPPTTPVTPKPPTTPTTPTTPTPPTTPSNIGGLNLAALLALMGGGQQAQSTTPVLADIDMVDIGTLIDNPLQVASGGSIDDLLGLLRQKG